MAGTREALLSKSSSPVEQGGRIWIPALATALAASLIYLGFLSCQYNFDGTVFALWLKEALARGATGPLWHPRHLIYLPIGYALGRALAPLNLGAVTVLQLLDTAFAFLSLLLYQVIAFRMTRDRAVSLATTLALAFSFGFWHFAIEAEVYLGQIFFLLLSFHLLLFFTSGRAPGSWAFRAFCLGLCGAAAMSAHLVSGLFLLPLGVGALLYLRPTTDGWADRLGQGIAPALVYSITALAAAAAVYAHGFAENPLARGQSFFSWVVGSFNQATGFGYRVSFWDLGPNAPREWLSGMKLSFVAGREFLLAPSPWLSLSRAVALAGIVAGAVLYAMELKRRFRKDARVQVLLLTALLPPAGFAMIWEPANFEIKAPLLPFLWLAAAWAAAGAAERLKSRRGAWAVPVACGLVALCLFANNFFGAALPGAKIENNHDLARAMFVRDHTEPDAVVYLAGAGGGYNLGKIYLVYFAGRQTRVVDWILARSAQPFPGPLLQSLVADREKPVYVLSELVGPGPALDRLAARDRFPAEKMIELWRGLGIERKAAMPDGFALYRVTFRH